MEGPKQGHETSLRLRNALLAVMVSRASAFSWKCFVLDSEQISSKIKYEFRKLEKMGILAMYIDRHKRRADSLQQRKLVLSCIGIVKVHSANKSSIVITLVNTPLYSFRVSPYVVMSVLLTAILGPTFSIRISCLPSSVR